MFAALIGAVENRSSLYVGDDLRPHIQYNANVQYSSALPLPTACIHPQNQSVSKINEMGEKKKIK